MLVLPHFNNHHTIITMSTTQETKQDIGTYTLHNTTNGEETVHDVVESWNWNMNIFEIYDEIREWPEHEQSVVLEYAFHYFNRDNMINELASFLLGQGFDE